MIALQFQINQIISVYCRIIDQKQRMEKRMTVTKRMMARKQARELGDEQLKSVSGGMYALHPGEESSTGTDCHRTSSGGVCCGDHGHD